MRGNNFLQAPPPLFPKILVVLATMIWGSAFLVMKNTLDTMGPYYILALRFTIAAVLLAIFCAPQWKRDFTPSFLWEGAVMGTLLFWGYAFQSIGLTDTTPGKNAFLTVLYCVEVPFLCWLFYRRRPDRFDVIGAGMCLIGMGLVSLDGALTMGWGDQMTVVCSVFYALHIVAASAFTQKHNAMLLTVLQFAFSAVWAWGCSLFTGEAIFLPTGNEALSILYMAVFATCLALSFQNYGEKHLPAAPLSILLSLESVFGVLFSVLFGTERPTIPMLIGFAVIFAAVLISQTKLSFLSPFRKKEETAGE